MLLQRNTKIRINMFLALRSYNRKHHAERLLQLRGCRSLCASLAQYCARQFLIVAVPISSIFWILDWPYSNSIFCFWYSCQITQHKWAWPFMQPVDVKGLGLHDYYEVKHFGSFSFILKLKNLFWWISTVWFSYFCDTFICLLSARQCFEI